MNDEFVGRIADAVAAKLAETPYSVDPERHAMEHRFIAEFIEERAARRRLWVKVQESTLGWLAIGVVAGVGAASYKLIHDWVMRGGQ